MLEQKFKGDTGLSSRSGLAVGTQGGGGRNSEERKQGKLWPGCKVNN